MDTNHQELTRISVNAENMPIFFFGHAKTKEKLERQIVETGKPLVIFDITLPGGRTKKLSIAPNAVYGLLTGFDYDVLTVLYHFVFHKTRSIGICPYALRVPLADFPKVMKLPVNGKLYKDVTTSVKRICSLDIYHEDFMKIRNEDGDLETYQERNFRLFNYAGLYKEERSQGPKNRISKHFIDIDIPDWQRNNFNHNYTTDIDIDLYFSLGGRRTKKLYRFLDLIRWNKTAKIAFSKLQMELQLLEMDTKIRNKTIKRSFESLVDIGYLESYELLEDSIFCTFKEIKIPTPVKPAQTLRLDAFKRNLVDDLVTNLKDEKSRRWYEILVSKLPEEMIYKCLSLTRETSEISGIKKSPGAVFTDHIKRECSSQQLLLF